MTVISAVPKSSGLKWWRPVGGGGRKFYDLARLTKAPIAAEAVKRIDVLFAIEREINGLAP